MSNQDFKKPLDTSYFTEISGAQLSQMFDGLTPFDDKGLVIVTNDIAGNPVPPDANATPKFKNYLWLRKAAASCILYNWNENVVSSATLLKWVPSFQQTLQVNAVGTDQIQDNAVTDPKIVSLDYNKLIGAPTTLPPSGVAGGSLGGTYPNPTLNPPDASIAPVKLTIPPGTPGGQLKIKDDGTAAEFATYGVIQRVVKQIAGQKVSNSVTTDGNPAFGEGTQIASVSFTPISTSSIIRVQLIGEMGCAKSVAAKNSNFSIFVDGVLKTYCNAAYDSNGPSGQSSMEVNVDSWGAGVAKNVIAKFGTTDVANQAKFGVVNGISALVIEEWFGTLTTI